jgi:hypothetical protein
MPITDVGVLIKVVDPIGIKKRSPSFYTVHLIAFFEEKLRQISPILPGYSGNKCFFHIFTSC